MMRNITSVVSLFCRFGLSVWTTVPLVCLFCLQSIRALTQPPSWSDVTKSLGAMTRRVSTRVIEPARSRLGACSMPYPAKHHIWYRSLPLTLLLFLFSCQQEALTHSTNSPNSSVLNRPHLLSPPLSPTPPSSVPHLPLPAHLSSDPLITPDTADNENEDQHSSSLCDRDGITALGMESGQIPDSALSASTFYDLVHVGPANARLRTHINGGAWCPKIQVGPDSSETEWIQVDLGAAFVITGVATQGRFGNGMGQEFTPAYNVYFSRQASPSNWTLWKSWEGRSTLEGNIDLNTVEENHLELPIVGARHIRLVPLSNHTRTVCLRFELYGCSYQGPIAYSSPVISNQTDPRLLDSSYDGERLDSTGLVGGLGKLINGIKASQNDDPNRDTVWVGWPRPNGSDSHSIELVFEFDQVYNFTTVSINCLNNYSYHVRVFSTAMVWLSLDRKHWSQSPIRFEYQADNVIELPRDVIIHLQYRIGRFVRIELTYHSEWLQISEVSFDCRPLSGNFSITQVEDLFGRLNSLQYNQASDDASAGGTRYIMPEDNLYNQSGKGGKPLFPVQQDASNPNVKYSLIIICLCTLGLVVISLLTSLTLKKLNNRKNNVFREISDTDLESENATINMKNLPKEASPLYCEPKEISPLQEEAEYAIPDVICPSNLSKTLNFQKSAANAVACKTLQINPRFYASSDIICAKQNIYGTRPGSQILNVFDIANLRALNPSQQYSVQQQQQQKQQLSQQQTPLLDTFCGRKQSGTALHNARSSFYGDTIANGSYGVRAYSEAEIGVLQSLGKSKFGDVLLCNIPAVGKNRLAVVRTVNDLNLKAEFTSSMQFMRQLSLNCDKFARLFGIIETPTYFASITEHADCDLNYYLRKSSPDHLSYETLLYIASEIANAGAYLESSKHTHRDIATRNVIVYEKNLTVKLTDVAMYEDKYAIDYFNGLPIRWMSPESVVRTEFTTQSDVYAFGVCFWEILTFGKCRPFADFSDEDLISAIYSYIDNGEHFVRLPPPSHCSTEIFELIEECCNSNETQRPSFKEICLFLQRKTLGFPKQMSPLTHL